MVVEIQIRTCYRCEYVDKLGMMKTKLAYKIFLAFFLTAAVIAALLIGMQYYAIRNFADYANRVELDKLESLEAQLITIYDQGGDWEPLRDNREGWRDLLEEEGIDMRPPHPPPHERKGRPEPPGRRPFEEDGTQDRSQFQRRPPPPPPPPHGTPDPLRIGPRLALFDANKILIVLPGDREAMALRARIETAANEDNFGRIGW